MVTDPPFFDNVHYSELADFFHAWTANAETPCATTRTMREVQDTDQPAFSAKLQGVFEECGRVLKPGGLLVFTYHHSRSDGWRAVAEAILGSGFVVVNIHPVRAEMTVAAPKSQAREPIQLDVIVVCRRASDPAVPPTPDYGELLAAAERKLTRLQRLGFSLSQNDHQAIWCGQLLTSLRSQDDVTSAFLGSRQPAGSEHQASPAHQVRRRPMRARAQTS